MKNKSLILFLVMVLLVLNRPFPASAESTTLAILPFQIHAEKDYGFLQKGIMDMLTSRLAMIDKAKIVDPLLTTKSMDGVQGMSKYKQAQMVGNQIKAAYVIYGSITALGEMVSIDAAMIDVTKDKTQLSFFKTINGIDGVIPQIDELAKEIIDRLQPGSIPLLSQTDAPHEQIDTKAMTAAPENHPQEMQQSPSEKKPALNISDKFWKSRIFNSRINGLAVGDVNLDGLQEVVVADNDKIIILQCNSDYMRELAVIDNPKFTQNLAVDVGDINGNGTPEIFVTAATSGLDTLSSFVLEFNGSEYRKVQTGSKWYFRIVHHGEKGIMLLGQVQNLDADAFAMPIKEMIWDGMEYRVESHFLQGNNTNAIGVATGVLVEGDPETVLAFGPNDRLQLFDASGKKIYTSDKPYGGSDLYILKRPSIVDDSKIMGEKIYLPLRIRLADLNHDGKMEVVVPRNIDKAYRLLSQHRLFKTSTLVAMNWDGLGLIPIWETHEIEGRIQDVFIGDYNNDGKNELLAAVVIKEGAFIGTKAESALIAFVIP